MPTASGDVTLSMIPFYCASSAIEQRCLQRRLAGATPLYHGTPTTQSPEGATEYRRGKPLYHGTTPHKAPKGQRNTGRGKPLYHGTTPHKSPEGTTDYRQGWGLFQDCSGDVGCVKILPILQTPPLTPPLEGRGVPHGVPAELFRQGQGLLRDCSGRGRVCFGTVQPSPNGAALTLLFQRRVRAAPSCGRRISNVFNSFNS